MPTDTRSLWYMLLASFFFALMALCVKLLARIPVFEVIFVRALISAGLCLWGLRRARVSPLGKQRLMLFFRGLAGALSLTQGFYLVQTIPLAAASTLTHLAPIFTTLIGVWFVKEKVTPLQITCFVLSFAGVVLIQGFDYRISFGDLLLGIGASLMTGLAYNSVRKLGGTEHPLVIMFWFPLVCLPLTGLWTLFNWVQPQGLEWLWLLLMGLMTQLGQYYMTVSYQLGRIARVAIVNYTEVLFALALGFILFAEHFNILTYAGMALVMVGVVLSMVLGPREPQPPLVVEEGR